MPKFDIAAALADGYSYSEIASYLSDLHGFDLNAAKYDGIGEEEVAGFLSAREVKPLETGGKDIEGGFMSSAKSVVGQTAKGAGRVASDFFGADPNNAVSEWGQGVVDANPLAVRGIPDILSKPGTAVTEAMGNAAPPMAGMAGARLVGQGITALSPLAGPAAPVVAGIGRGISWLGPAAIAALPSFSGIRDKQILKDEAYQDSAKAKAIAALGAGTVGFIEQKFGPQNWAMAALTKEGREELAKKLVGKTIEGSIGKGILRGGAEEGAEELVQNPVEQVASFEDPSTPESVKETLFGGAMGAIGGAVLGAGGGALSYATRTPEQTGPDPYAPSQMPDFEADRQRVEGLQVPTPIIPPLQPADFAGISAVPDALSAMGTQPTVTAKVDTATQQVENATTPKGYGNPLDTAGEIITAVRGADEAKLAELEKALETPELDDFASSIRGDIADRREELAKRPEILPADPQPDPQLIERTLAAISTADQPTLLQMADGLPGLVEGSPELAPYQRQLSEAISKRQRILWEESNVGRGTVQGDQGGVAARGEQVASSDGTGQLSEVSARGHRPGDANPVHGAGVEGLDNRDQGATGGRVAPEGAGENRAGIEQASPLLTAARQHVAETGDLTMGGLAMALDVDIDTAADLLEQVKATTPLPRNIAGTQAATRGVDTSGFLTDQAIRKAGATSLATTAGDAQGFVADQGIRKATGTATAATGADTEGFVRDQQIRRDAMARGPKPTRAADEPARAFLARKREWEASASQAGGNETQAELPRTDETQAGAGGADIGPNTPDGYVTAKKQPGGKYKLFFTGTRNEVFSGELFDSAKQARDYFKVRREKLRQAHTTPKTTSTSDLPSAGTGTVPSPGEASNVAAEMKKLVASIKKSDAKLEKLHEGQLARMKNGGQSRATSTTYAARSGNEAKHRDGEARVLANIARAELRDGRAVPQDVLDILGSKIEYNRSGDYEQIASNAKPRQSADMADVPETDFGEKKAAQPSASKATQEKPAGVATSGQRQEQPIKQGDVSVGDTVYFTDVRDETKRIPANFRGFNGPDQVVVVYDGGKQMALPMDRVFKEDAIAKDGEQDRKLREFNERIAAKQRERDEQESETKRMARRGKEMERHFNLRTDDDTPDSTDKQMEAATNAWIAGTVDAPRYIHGGSNGKPLTGKTLLNRAPSKSFIARVKRMANNAKRPFAIVERVSSDGIPRARFIAELPSWYNERRTSGDPIILENYFFDRDTNHILDTILPDEENRTGFALPQDRATEPAQPEAASGELGEGDGIVEHTTKRGKVLRGRIVTGISYRQAKEADPYTFKKDGGFFIREGAGEVKKDGAPAEVKETAPEKGEAQPKENLAIKRLRISAERLKAAGEAKLNQDRNANTALRARMANNAEADARADIRTAETLLNIVNAQEDGTAGALAGLTSKAQLETLQGILTQAKYAEERKKENGKQDHARPANKDDIKSAVYLYPHFYDYKDLDALIDLLGNKKGWRTKRNDLRRGGLVVNGKDRIETLREALKLAGDDYRFRTVGEHLKGYDRLQKAGITDDLALREALEKLVELSGKAPEKNRAQELERALVGQNNGIDFFPTPKAQAKFIVDRAGIEPGMRVLEPSAGTGNLAEEMRAQGGEVEVAEISPAHREVLEAKGFKIVEHDFMDMEEGGYDVIVMNPPFSNNMDIDHVRKAYELLKPGGRVVAIMGEGAFFRTGKKETEFREWLDEVGINEKLPEGFFTDKKELRTTGVNARVVEIDKPAGAETPMFDEKQEAVEAEQTDPTETATVEPEAETGTAAESPTRLHTVSGYPSDNATKKHMLEAIAEARKELPEPSPKDGFSNAERIDWPKPTTEKSHKIYRLAGNFKLVVDPTGYARLVEDMGSSGKDGSKIPDKVHGKPIGSLAEAKLWAEYYLLGKAEPSGPPHVFRGKNKEYEYTIPNSAYALDNFEKKVKGSSGVKFSEQTGPTLESIKEKYAGRIDTIFVHERNDGDIHLASVIVGKGNRQQGIGSEFMADLVAYADANGKRIVLSPGQPDDRHGTTSRARLVRFYKRFGFIENKGRNKDYKISEGMYRVPAPKYSTALPPSARADIPGELTQAFGKLRARVLMRKITVLESQEEAKALVRRLGGKLSRMPVKKGEAPSVSGTAEGLDYLVGGLNNDLLRGRIGGERVLYEDRFFVKTAGEKFKVRSGNVQSGRYILKGEDGEYIGAAQYTKIGRNVILSNIFTVKVKRRSGVGTKLVDELKKDFPGIKADSHFSEDGAAFMGIKYSKGGAIKGFAVDGKVYLVKDAIEKGHTIPVLKHEFAHIARLGLRGTKPWQALLRSVDERMDEDSATGKALREARKKVPADTDADLIAEETLAYAVELSPEVGLVRRAIAMIKRFLVNMGVSPNIFTVEDWSALAAATLRGQARVAMGEGVRQSVRDLFKPVDTESAAFKRWFGDSKVVGAEGKPLVVYTGTDVDAEIDEFNIPAYFTESKGEASAYTFHGDYTRRREMLRRYSPVTDGGASDGQRVPWFSDTDSVLPEDYGKMVATDEMVFKRIKGGRYLIYTDLVVDYESHDGDTIKVVAGESEEYADLSAEARDDAERYYAGGENGRVYPVYLAISNPKKLDAFEANVFGKRLSGDDAKSLWEEKVKELESAGYDGIETESDEARLMRSIDSTIAVPKQWLPFRPEQIKSAISNTGAFSPSDPRIRYSKQFDDGEVEAAMQVKPALKKNDLKWWERVFKTFDYLSRIDPAAKRIFQYGAEDRRENKVRLEDRILDNIAVPDGAYIDPQYSEKKEAGFVSFLTNLQKKDKATYTEANDYLLTVDRTGKAFSVKRQEGYTVKSPDGEVLATGLRTKEDGYTVIRDHHAANYGKDSDVLKKDYSNDKQSSWVVTNPKGAILSEHDTETEAVAARRDAEAGKMRADGNEEKTIAAVMQFREMTDRAFDLMAGDLRRVIDEAERLGLDEPTIEVVDERKRYVILDAQGNKVPESYYENRKDAELFAKSISHKGRFQVKKQADNEILMPMTLSAAISQMGDLRGSYFPRQRQTGAVVLTATKEGSNIRKNFDLYMLGGERTDIETGEVLTESKIKTFLRDRANRVTPLGLEMARLKADGYTVKVAPADRMPETVFEATQLFASINALIEDAAKGVKKDADPNLQRAYNELAKTLTMNIADTFKQRGYLSSRMKRTQDYWEGFETDMLKAGVQYAKGMAGGLAKREAAQKMTLALTGRETTFAEYQDQNPGAKWEDYQQFVRDNAIDPKTQPRLLEETKSWMQEMLRNDEQADRILGTIKGLAVLKFLGFRVSSAAVNMTNMVQAVPATIAAQTGTSISRALGQVGSSARLYKQYRTGKVEQADKEIFTEISERGWDNPQFNHEAAAVLRSKAGNWFAKFTDAAMWMFGQAEKVNRAVTIHAAYMQAKRMSPDLGHVGWMNKAKQISDDAHGVYGKETAPAWTRGAYNPLKLSYTFQRFMHNYFLNMGQMWERGKYKELTWMLISPALIAGPGATLLTPIAASMLGALGIGGDDPEEEFYTWAEQTFGEGSTGARVARHGFSGALGVNLKGSIEMGFAMPTTVAELFGAPGSLVTDVVDSARAFGKGEVSKGFEKALPTGMGTMLKANREQREGITTGGYSPVWYGDEPLKTTGGGSVARFFGFNPSVTSGVREKLWSEKRIEQKYASERKRINDRIRRLVLQNGGRIPSEDMDEIRGEVARYNERARGLSIPGVPLIKTSTIRQAIRSAKRPPRKERLRTNPNI